MTTPAVKQDIPKIMLDFGPCRVIDWEVLSQNQYRVIQGLWVTSHFKTYLQELYLKIPRQYFLHR